MPIAVPETYFFLSNSMCHIGYSYELWQQSGFYAE